MQRIKHDNPNTIEYWHDQAENREFLTRNFDGKAGNLPYEISKHINYGDRVLDVGVGSGMILRWVKKLRPDIYFAACDFNDMAVDWVREKIPINEVFQADLRTALPCSAGSYDVVYSTEVVEHMEEPAKAVEELDRISHRCFMITVSFREQGRLSSEHLWEFNIDDVYDLLSPYGMVYLTVVNGGSNILGVCYKR